MDNDLLTKEIEFLESLKDSVAGAEYGEGYRFNIPRLSSQIKRRITQLRMARGEVVADEVSRTEPLQDDGLPYSELTEEQKVIYQEIEHKIIEWSLDRIRTAGVLTRKIMRVLKDHAGVSGQELAGLLFTIHTHHPNNDKIIYFEEDLLPVLKAVGLPEPEWGQSLELSYFLKKKEQSAQDEQELPCTHQNIEPGHHADQPSWCKDCGEEL